MASSPRFKVYDVEGNYLGCAKDPAMCAVMVSFAGEGATIRGAHSKGSVFWTEGESGDAADSYDAVCEAAGIYDRSTAYGAKA